jgi:hypothetical protein
LAEPRVDFNQQRILDADLTVKASRGRFDADDYARQTAAE